MKTANQQHSFCLNSLCCIEHLFWAHGVDEPITVDGGGAAISRPDGRNGKLRAPILNFEHDGRENKLEIDRAF